MKENASEDCDPPPDSRSLRNHELRVGEPNSVYSGQGSSDSAPSPGYDPDREYRNFVLPNEDDDPKYHEALLRSYRGDNTMFVMDRGWQF